MFNIFKPKTPEQKFDGKFVFDETFDEMYNFYTMCPSTIYIVCCDCDGRPVHILHRFPDNREDREDLYKYDYLSYFSSIGKFIRTYKLTVRMSSDEINADIVYGATDDFEYDSFNMYTTEVAERDDSPLVGVTFPVEITQPAEFAQRLPIGEDDQD
jgi:hypothetical protein